jgi:hypothetical protein
MKPRGAHVPYALVVLLAIALGVTQHLLRAELRDARRAHARVANALASICNDVRSGLETSKRFLLRGTESANDDAAAAVMHDITMYPRCATKPDISALTTDGLVAAIAKDYRRLREVVDELLAVIPDRDRGMR